MSPSEAEDDLEPLLGTRRQARELALSLLYEADAKSCTPAAVPADFPIAPDQLADLVLGDVGGDVALGEDADDLVAVDHRQAANLVLLHGGQRLVDRVVGPDGDDLALIAQIEHLGALRILARSHDLHRDVAVG